MWVCERVFVADVSGRLVGVSVGPVGAAIIVAVLALAAARPVVVSGIVLCIAWNPNERLSRSVRYLHCHSASARGGNK